MQQSKYLIFVLNLGPSFICWVEFVAGIAGRIPSPAEHWNPQRRGHRMARDVVGENRQGTVFECQPVEQGGRVVAKACIPTSHQQPCVLIGFKLNKLICRTIYFLKNKVQPIIYLIRKIIKLYIEKIQ
jgi:hypothetical protein